MHRSSSDPTSSGEWWIACIAALVVFMSACQVAPPLPGLPVVTHDAERSCEPDACTLLESYRPMLEDVNFSLKSAGGINFNWVIWNTQLPNPGPWWDATEDPEEYFAYAEFWRFETYPFGGFFATHMFNNPFPGECPGEEDSYALAVTPRVVNQVATEAWQRVSFLFLTDISNVMQACGYSMSGRQNAMNFVLGHELGHQRAGLTHPNDPQFPSHAQYHTPEGQIDDVMRTGVLVSDLGARRYPSYCRTSDTLTAGDEDSCQGVLFLWRAF